MEEPEIGVQDTNAEATASKMYLNFILTISSAINKGYFTDIFSQQFVNNVTKKDVIIHRGYWSRVNIFRKMMDKFLSCGKTNIIKIQVIIKIRNK